jgi:hypothetical protein
LLFAELARRDVVARWRVLAGLSNLRRVSVEGTLKSALEYELSRDKVVTSLAALVGFVDCDAHEALQAAVPSCLFTCLSQAGRAHLTMYSHVIRSSAVHLSLGS